MLADFEDDFTIAGMMGRQENIRHISIIAQLTDEEVCVTDILNGETPIHLYAKADDEIKPAAISIMPRMSDYGIDAVKVVQGVARSDDGESDENRFLINVINARDSSGGVTAPLRAADGALLVIDYASGVDAGTEAALRQAICGRIKPIVLIDKMDAAVKELDLEELYQKLLRIIDRINGIVIECAGIDGPMGDIRVSPVKGTVAFGSVSQGWAFTLENYADMFAKKAGMEPEELVKRLWGDHFYNCTTEQWSEQPEDDVARGFDYYVYVPINIVFDTVSNKTREDALALAHQWRIELDDCDMGLAGEELFLAIMRRWRPAGDLLRRMMCVHLPSPVTAQRYRTELLYGGPDNDEAAVAMKACDPKGPLMVYISAMVPAAHGGPSYAFGRIFSGTCVAGQEVRVLGPDHGVGNEEHTGIVRGTVAMRERGVEAIGEVPCGNICGLRVVDQVLVEGSTISTLTGAHIMRVLDFNRGAPIDVGAAAAQPPREDEICLICYGEVLDADRCEYALCAGKHRFCTECLIQMIRKEKYIIVAKCPIDMRENCNIRLWGRKDSVFYFHMELDAQRAVASAIGDKIEWAAEIEEAGIEEAERRRLNALIFRILTTDRLPETTCLSCFQDLGAAAVHYAFEGCFREHAYCAECAARVLGSRCPLPHARELLEPISMMAVLNGKAYKVPDAHMQDVRNALAVGGNLIDVHRPETIQGFGLRHASMDYPHT